MTSSSKLPEILRRHESEILNDWMRHQLSSTVVRGNLIRESELREQSSAFLATLREALESGKPARYGRRRPGAPRAIS